MLYGSRVDAASLIAGFLARAAGHLFSLAPALTSKNFLAG